MVFQDGIHRELDHGALSSPRVAGVGNAAIAVGYKYRTSRECPDWQAPCETRLKFR